MNTGPRRWKDWLLSDTPASRRQAALGLAYRRWRRFAGNPLSVFGFVILALLIIVAASGPLIAPHDPLQQVLSDCLRVRRRTGSAPTSLAATSSRG